MGACVGVWWITDGQMGGRACGWRMLDRRMSRWGEEQVNACMGGWMQWRGERDR